MSLGERQVFNVLRTFLSADIFNGQECPLYVWDQPPIKSNADLMAV